ncbi:hypothetical protein L1987_08812 [Smallanthus sonchifolius]|uniref:Uncharacterized protein n=1 Tax=Smallanthus sonchifolius TaxID=185202 RepID=A0ACB9JLQ0_9ASTR|nr:hypothetical protein L1987_08812 [Smallanthus sonchifolius]
MTTLTGYDGALVACLALKPSKIRALAESVRRLAEMEEPIGQVLKRTEVLLGYNFESVQGYHFCPPGNCWNQINWTTDIKRGNPRLAEA